MHLTDLLILVSQSCYYHNFEGADIHVLKNFLTVFLWNSVKKSVISEKRECIDFPEGIL